MDLYSHHSIFPLPKFMPRMPNEFQVTSRFRKATTLSSSNFFSSFNLLFHLSSWAHS